MLEDIELLLSRLGEQLEMLDSPAISLVVCGGTALNITGLVSRTTRDIDILGQLDEQSVREPELPEEFWRAARNIQNEFELEEDWINTQPGVMTKTGLPKGLPDRLEIKKYSSKLKIGFISRIDQIYFKLWAATDRDRTSYHVQDLKKLEPTDSEIKEAARWCMKQDPSKGFRKILLDMLNKLGFDQIAEKI